MDNYVSKITRDSILCRLRLRISNILLLLTNRAMLGKINRSSSLLPSDSSGTQTRGCLGVAVRVPLSLKVMLSCDMSSLQIKANCVGNIGKNSNHYTQIAVLFKYRICTLHWCILNQVIGGKL